MAIPVIASINGTTTEGWLKYARLLQRAGADAVELNFYHLATDPAEDAASVEDRLLDIVAVLKESIAIPLAVKLSPFHSSLPNLAKRGSTRLARRVSCCSTASIRLTSIRTSSRQSRPAPVDIRRAAAAASLAGDFVDDLSRIAGNYRRRASADPRRQSDHGRCGRRANGLGALENGVEQLTAVRDGVARWGDEHGYESIDQIRDSMSLAHSPNPRAAERRNYLRILQSWKRVRLK